MLEDRINRLSDDPPIQHIDKRDEFLLLGGGLLGDLALGLLTCKQLAQPPPQETVIPLFPCQVGDFVQKHTTGIMHELFENIIPWISDNNTKHPFSIFFNDASKS
ncbi:MAG: hypothetical protein WAM14_09380 [Candidatus Nitrosopolaris sp.]